MSLLKTQHYDLIVIGGGITGSGIAQDAATRGMRVALVERSDFACGTSSRSSKLIHGGLRYLAQGDFKVTRESCAERELLLVLAPHLVHRRSFLVPIYTFTYGLQIGLGLWVYDFIARKYEHPLHRRVSSNEIVRLVPMIRREGLLGGYIYHDCAMNDARLLIEVLKSAASHGATIVNYVEAKELRKHNNLVCGIIARDTDTNELFDISADVIVNACGVWMDKLCKADDPSASTHIRPAKGAHIVIARNRIPTVDVALLFASGAGDNRSLFFIPWYEATIIGTTDTDYNGDLDAPRASESDVDYILDATRRVFPSANLTRKDIISTYAGLRPLINTGGRSTKDISRNHKIFESPSGLISIAGGKYTTYRRMATEVVDKVAERLKKTYRSCCTDSIYLSDIDAAGGIDKLTEEVARRASDYGLEQDVAVHLVENYGAAAMKVLDIVAERKELAERCASNLPFILAEAAYAIKHESVLHLEDFLVRRTRAALVCPDQGVAIANKLLDLFAEELNWDAAKAESELERYRAYVTQYRPV